MDREAFLIEHWEKKSNAVLAFIVLQSIVLADKLAEEHFVIQIKKVSNLLIYLFVAHTFIFISALIILLSIDTKVAKLLKGNEAIQKDIELHKTLWVKVVLSMIFGLIPVFIFFYNLF